MTDRPTAVTGGCLCGEIRYTAQAFLHSGYVCHCRICQRSTGQPAEISVPVRRGTLVFVQGSPRYYVSSQLGRRAFCGTCGSRLAWQALDPANDWMSSVEVGSLDDPATVRLECHIFVETQLPWYELRDTLPRYTEAELEPLIEKWREARGGG
jgi:hypothetical protein